MSLSWRHLGSFINTIRRPFGKSLMKYEMEAIKRYITKEHRRRHEGDIMEVCRSGLTSNLPSIFRSC